MNMQKLNILKKLIGKKVVVIQDHIKNIYFYAYVESVVDDMHVSIKNENGASKPISIFDIRSPSPEYP